MDKNDKKLKKYDAMDKQGKKVPAGKNAKEKDVSKVKMARQKASDKQADKKLGMKVEKKIKC